MVNLKKIRTRHFAGRCAALLAVCAATAASANAQQTCDDANKHMWDARQTASYNIYTFGGSSSFPNQPVILRNAPVPDRLDPEVVRYPLKTPELLSGFSCEAEYDPDRWTQAAPTAIVCTSTRWVASPDAFRSWLSGCLISDGFEEWESTRGTPAYAYSKMGGKYYNDTEYKVWLRVEKDYIELEYSLTDYGG